TRLPSGLNSQPANASFSPSVRNSLPVTRSNTWMPGPPSRTAMRFPSGLNHGRGTVLFRTGMSCRGMPVSRYHNSTPSVPETNHRPSREYEPDENLMLARYRVDPIRAIALCGSDSAMAASFAFSAGVSFDLSSASGESFVGGSFEIGGNPDPATVIIPQPR